MQPKPRIEPSEAAVSNQPLRSRPRASLLQHRILTATVPRLFTGQLLVQLRQLKRRREEGDHRAGRCPRHTEAQRRLPARIASRCICHDERASARHSEYAVVHSIFRPLVDAEAHRANDSNAHQRRPHTTPERTNPLGAVGIFDRVREACVVALHAGFGEVEREGDEGRHDR